MTTKQLIRRTLFVGIGDVGQAVCEAADRSLSDWGAPPVVQSIILSAPDAAEADLDAALWHISHLRHRTALSELGYRLDDVEDLVIWVVADNSGDLSWAAHLAQQRADRYLGSQPFLMGLTVQSDLAEVTSGYRDTSFRGDDNGDRRWLLDAPCFRVMPLNENGMAVGNQDELVDLVGRFLVLHTCTPLQDSTTWMTQGLDWQSQATWASFGLTSVVWPTEIVHEQASVALQRDVLTQLLKHMSTGASALTNLAIEPIDTQVASSVAAPPGLLGRAFLPEAFSDIPPVSEVAPSASGLWDVLLPSDGSLSLFLQRLEQTLARWQATVTDSGPAWKALRSERLSASVARIRANLQRTIDTQGLRAGQAFLIVAREELASWADGAAAKAEEMDDNAAHLLSEADTHWQAMTQLLDLMPRSSVRSVLRFVLRPDRAIKSWGHWVDFQAAYGEFIRLRTARCAAQVVARQMREASRLYQETIAAVGEMMTQLARVIDQLQETLAVGAPQAWPKDSFLLADDPQTLTTALMSRYLPSTTALVEAFLEEWGPLSGWLEAAAPAAGDLRAWFREVTEPIGSVPIWEVIALQYPDEAERQMKLQELAELALPFWRWDPAVLSEAERTRVGRLVLGLVAPQSDGLLGNGSSLRELAIPYQDRLIIVSLLWGVPGCETAEAPLWVAEGTTVLG